LSNDTKKSAALDLAKLAKVLSRLESDRDAEVVNAGRLANRLLRASGRHWADFVEAFKEAENKTKEAERATAAAAELFAENTALRAELDELRSTNGAVWRDISAPGSSMQSSVQQRAKWALDLHAQGTVRLTPGFEVPFLTRCSTWRGQLTSKMQPIYERIITHVANCTGRVPP
jgi:hypothetical protein